MSAERPRARAHTAPELRRRRPRACPRLPPSTSRPTIPCSPYLQGASGAVEIESLDLDSSALAELKAAGVKLAVPLVSQGELIGVLNLGPRLSEQDYSSDDRKLLDNLAARPPRRCGSASSYASRKPRLPPASASSRSLRWRG